ncbi:MAG: ribosome maturation factor RimM [Holosporaceae bacterium]
MHQPPQKTAPQTDAPALVCVGAILGPHGLKGLLSVHSYRQDPLALFSCGPLLAQDGQPLLCFDPDDKPTSKGIIKGYPCFLVRPQGCTTRTEAEAFGKQKLYMKRSALPASDAALYYHCDLKGLWALSEEGQVIGRVQGVQNFNAGDLLDIQLFAKPLTLDKAQENGASGQALGRSLFVRFHKDCVSKVDLDKGTVTLFKQALQDVTV